MFIFLLMLPTYKRTSELDEVLEGILSNSSPPHIIFQWPGQYPQAATHLVWFHTSIYKFPYQLMDSSIRKRFLILTWNLILCNFIQWFKLSLILSYMK